MKILFKIIVNLIVYIFVFAGTGLTQESGRTYIPIWPPKAVYPIAVVEFKNLDGKPDLNNTSKQMAEIISNDLDFTPEDNSGGHHFFLIESVIAPGIHAVRINR